MSKHLVLDKFGWPIESIKGRPVSNFIRKLLYGRAVTLKRHWETNQRLDRLTRTIAYHIHRLYIDPPEHYGPTIDKLEKMTRGFYDRNTPQTRELPNG